MSELLSSVGIDYVALGVTVVAVVAVVVSLISLWRHEQREKEKLSIPGLPRQDEIWELDVLNEHRISLIGFNSLSHRTMIILLSQYAQTINPCSTPEESFAKLLENLKQSNEKFFKTLDVYKFPQISELIFTDITKAQLKKSISFDKLDITTLCDILQNIPSLPSCKSKHRRNLSCTGFSHKKCCAKCNGKHLCLSCAKENCGKICCVTKAAGNCNHECIHSNCSTLRTKCTEDATVCCKLCGHCENCKVKLKKSCISKDIRLAVEIIESIRNMTSHNDGDDVWNKLDSNTFSSPYFPGCTSWDDLWKTGRKHLLSILDYLKNSNLLSKDDYESMVYKLNQFKQLTKNELLHKYTIDLFSEHIRMTNHSLIKQKELVVGFELTIPNAIWTEDMQKLTKYDGDLIDIICSAVDELVKLKTGSDAVEVVITNCKLNRAAFDPKVIDVELKMTGQTLDGNRELCQYHNGKSDASKTLWVKMKNEILKVLKEEEGIQATIDRVGWNLGSIVLTLAVEKTDGRDWTISEIKTVLRVLQRVSSTCIESVESSVVLLKNENTQQNHIQMAFNLQLHDDNLRRSIDLKMLSTESKKCAEQIIEKYLQSRKQSLIKSVETRKEWKEQGKMHASVGERLRKMSEEAMSEFQIKKDVKHSSTNVASTSTSTAEQRFCDSSKHTFYELYDLLRNESTRDQFNAIIEFNPSLTKLRDDRNYTLLYRAAYHGATECVEVLIKNGSDVKEKNVSGWMVIHYAARNNNTRMMKILLSHDPSSVNVTSNDNNNTPLHHAARLNHREAVELLLSQPSVDVNVRDCGGKTPYELTGDYQIKTMIRSHRNYSPRSTTDA